ncbi:MAG: hypothetical protein PHC41_13590 [Lachnospiraceae bacterium]|nr:hypothetical protein [Lachnospiraceae bacterium]MDD3617239.1 hypothetical protein [Lachnospiraceae bacterium]
MRLEDMKKDIPETPEFIHRMLQNEVKKQLQDTNAVEIPARRIKKWTGGRVAAAVVFCTLATATITFAGTKLYHMFSEKQGTYSIVTGIKTDDNAVEINLPEKIHDIDITAGYIPEGMKWIDETHLEYPEHNRMGGFSFVSSLLDNDNLDKVIQDKSVVESEERTFGKYEGVYLKYHDLAAEGFFNQRIYLLCPDVYRVITVYIGEDISKEDAFKVVESLAITENDTMLETAGLHTWSEIVSQGEVSGEEVPASIADDKLPIHQLGESIDILAFGEDSEGRYMEDNKISVCLNTVQIADDLQLLDQNHVPEEWKNAVGADGKLVDNTLSYIKSGDGIESVDVIVKTESIKQKLVYATVTYTNNSEKEINHMLYLGALMQLSHEDGRYQIYDQTEQSGTDYDFVTGDGAAHTGEMTYYSVSEDYGNGENYISSLKAGESIQVNMAWIVNEQDLDNMYLNLSGDGAVYEFSESMLKAGLVDIS